MFLDSASVVFAQYIEAKCSVENEDVVGAAPTGDAPTTSEWSTIYIAYSSESYIIDLKVYFAILPEEFVPSRVPHAFIVSWAPDSWGRLSSCGLRPPFAPGCWNTNNQCSVFVIDSGVLWSHIASKNLVIIGSGDDLSLVRAKPLPEPIMTNRQLEQTILIKNTKLFVPKNTSENVICKWLPFCWGRNMMGLYSLSGKMSYRKILWSLEATWFRSRLFQSLWILTGIYACRISERYNH